MTMLTKSKELTVGYFKKGGYTGMIIVSGSPNEAENSLWDKMGSTIIDGKSVDSKRVKDINYITYLS